MHSVDQDLGNLGLDFRDDSECSSAVDRSASFCKSVALVVSFHYLNFNNNSHAMLAYSLGRRLHRVIYVS